METNNVNNTKKNTAGSNNYYDTENSIIVGYLFFLWG